MRYRAGAVSDQRQSCVKRRLYAETEQAKRLTELLERYEEILDLQEQRDTIRRLLEAPRHLNFQYELQSGQLPGPGPQKGTDLSGAWL